MKLKFPKKKKNKKKNRKDIMANEEVEQDVSEDVNDESQEDEDLEYEYGLYDDEEEEKDIDDYIVRRHNMFKLMGFIVIGVVVVGLFLFILSLFAKPVYTYNELEKELKKAAISYFKDFPESLPQEDGSIVEIDSSNLVTAKKMKDLSSYKLKNDAVCTGTVQVQKVDSSYVYTPYLNCGGDYATEELYKVIIKNNPTTNSGYGLYANNGNYIFRGEVVNNYLQLDKDLWRIVKITPNNELVLINATGYSISQPWDDRYNQSSNYNSGINNYETSRIKEYLERVYKSPNVKRDEDILSAADKAKMVEFDVCVGKRDANDERNDNSVECSQVVRNQKMGLLTLSEYIYASIDTNCKSANTKACRNYNYLNRVKEWWLATPDSVNDYSAYRVKSNGTIVSQTTSLYSGVRPVIHINSRVLYKSGDGSKEKPYKVK